MFHVKDDFRASAPITQVGAGWFNKVGSFLNNLVGGRGIRLIKNEGGVSVIALEEGIGSGGSGAVKSVDGHGPDADGAVSFGLAADKWLKTDGAGHIATADETPVALPSGKTGVSQTVDVVTSLSWTGTQLVAGNAAITLTNGVVTAVATKANTVINTVTY